MKSSKRYYNSIDLIRILACISVLLYHMNLLKGGYLAVCTFFVLSGYLSCVSCFKKEKFSFKDYYVNKLKHLYLPLLIVVFLSIVAISIFPNINWFNLKPETTSVLLGYNNFWQLSANLDYFARHVSSPFMHLWYMGIILQFDLVFPFIYVIFRKIGDKLSKILTCTIICLISVALSIYFYKMSLNSNIMVTYYNTFTRIFSLFFGVTLGFIHSYYKNVIPNFLKSKYVTKFIFLLYLLVMMIFYVMIDSRSNFFNISMILVSFITCRLISYGTIHAKDNMSIFDKIVKSISSISYEIYLVQYPIIFLFQNISMDVVAKNITIIILVLLISYILQFAINFNKKFKILRILLFIIILIISIFGAYKYIIAKDHTQEMKDLEEKLAFNEKVMEERQKEYLNNLKKEEEDWLDTLKDLENSEKELANVVSNSSVVGIGDSVMLGAIDNLYKEFPNGYFDAKISRTAWVANGILADLKNKGMLGDNVVINLGANGDCPSWCKQEIMKTIGDRNVFWFNTTNDDNINKILLNFASDYDNLHIVDWKIITQNHPEYFVADKIHLTGIGKQVFTQTIYDEIYKVYLDEYNKKKQEILNSYEEKQKNKLTFIGNDILLNAYDYLKEDFPNVDFVINSEFNYESVKEEVIKRKQDNTLTYKIAFLFDENALLNEENYKTLIEICKENEIYILDSSQTLQLNYDNVTTINFYNQLIDNESYLMPDKIHLTNIGNEKLNDILHLNIKFER